MSETIEHARRVASCAPCVRAQRQFGAPDRGADCGTRRGAGAGRDGREGRAECLSDASHRGVRRLGLLPGEERCGRRSGPPRPACWPICPMPPMPGPQAEIKRAKENEARLRDEPQGDGMKQLAERAEAGQALARRGVPPIPRIRAGGRRAADRHRAGICRRGDAHGRSRGRRRGNRYDRRRIWVVHRSLKCSPSRCGRGWWKGATEQSTQTRIRLTRPRAGATSRALPLRPHRRGTQVAQVAELVDAQVSGYLWPQGRGSSSLLLGTNIDEQHAVHARRHHPSAPARPAGRPDPRPGGRGRYRDDGPQPASRPALPGAALRRRRPRPPGAAHSASLGGRGSTAPTCSRLLADPAR